MAAAVGAIDDVIEVRVAKPDGHRVVVSPVCAGENPHMAIIIMHRALKQRLRLCHF